MDSTVIVALISLIVTLGGSLGGIMVSSNLAVYKLYQFRDKDVSIKDRG